MNLAVGPILAVFLGCLLLQRTSHAVSKRVIALGALGVSGFFVVRLWIEGRSRSTGTLDGDPLSVFLSGLVLTALVLLVLGSPKSEAELPRLFAQATAALLVVSTRDLLWMVVGLEGGAWLLPRGRLWPTAVPSALTVLGLGLLAASAGGVDLAVVGTAPASEVGAVGLAVFFLGVVARWTLVSKQAWRVAMDVTPLAPSSFPVLSGMVATAALLLRVTAWLPSYADTWAPILAAVSVLGLLASGVGVVAASKLPSFFMWLSLGQGAYTGLALLGGVQARASLLMHLTAASVMLLLAALALDTVEEVSSMSLRDLGEAASFPAARLVTAVSLFSLASLPPLPGFVSKLPALEAVLEKGFSGSFAAAEAGAVLLAIGAMRLVSRLTGGVVPATIVDSRSRRGVFLSGVAFAAILGLGVLPIRFVEAASRAAMGLF